MKLTFLTIFLFSIAHLKELDARPLPSPTQICDLLLTIKGIENIERFVRYQYSRPDSSCTELGLLNLNGSPNLVGSGFTHHQICRQIGNLENKLFISAEIYPDDMKEGSKVDENARKRLKEFYKLCAADEAGHAISRELGGKGLEYNLFPQNRQLNAGKWNVVMGEVSTHLNLTIKEENQLSQQEERRLQGTLSTSEKPIIVLKRHATVEIAFLFTEKPGRPTRMFYILQLFEEGANIKNVFGRFDNVDHSDTKLQRCQDLANNYYYFVYDKNENYYARKTCRLGDRYKHLEF